MVAERLDVEADHGDGEGHEAVAAEGEDDGDEDERDVAAELVDEVPKGRGKEGCYQVDYA